MAEMDALDLKAPLFVDDEGDAETLAAIDQGIRDAEAGRVVPIEEVRTLPPSWTTASSSRDKR